MEQIIAGAVAVLVGIWTAHQFLSSKYDQQIKDQNDRIVTLEGRFDTQNTNVTDRLTRELKARHQHETEMGQSTTSLAGRIRDLENTIRLWRDEGRIS